MSIRSMSGETYSREELGPMILAWGRSKPVRCARCAAYAVRASLHQPRHGRTVTLTLVCEECGRRGDTTIDAP